MFVRYYAEKIRKTGLPGSHMRAMTVTTKEIKPSSSHNNKEEIGDESSSVMRSYNLLAYAVERVDITAPKTPIKSRNFSLAFEPYNTEKRFNDFNGVFVFQGTFERFNYESSALGSYRTHSYDQDELDKREKELHLLLKKGGFVCMILHSQFIDRNDTEDITNTDLSKRLLTYPSFHRNNFPERVTCVRPCRNEVVRFCELYGAACTTLQNNNKNIEMQPLVKVGNNVVGLVLWGNQFFLPSLLPEDHRIQEYFQTLADAIVSIRNKLITDIPPWVNTFIFNEEDEANVRTSELSKEIDRLAAQIDMYKRFKHILVADGDALVDAVILTLHEGYGFSVDSIDEFREDVKILGPDTKPLILAEIKGTNAGVKREYINQADSHRERAELPNNFPTLLIVNTHIKNARSILEKDHAIPSEQIIHAQRLSVLIIRTIDLLRLLRLLKLGKVHKSEILELFQRQTGWLRCNDESFDVLSK